MQTVSGLNTYRVLNAGVVVLTENSLKAVSYTHLNDYVRAGTPLSDGATTPADILAIKGPTAVQEYIVNEVQDVYRLSLIHI